MSDTKPIHALLAFPFILLNWTARSVLFLIDFALGLVCLPFFGVAILYAKIKGPASPSLASSHPGTAPTTPPSQDPH